MAGQTPLDTRYYPSDFCVTTIVLETGTSVGSYLLLYADREIIIDSINWIIMDGPTANEDFKFAKTADCIQPVYATASTYTALTGVITVPSATTTPVRYSTSDASVGTTVINMPFTLATGGAPAHNVLAKGSNLWLLADGAIAGIVAQTVQIRWRSQL